MSNKLKLRDFLESGNASQPQIIQNTTCEQPMQFAEPIDLPIRKAAPESKRQRKLFGTHIQEAAEIVKGWARDRERE